MEIDLTAKEPGKKIDTFLMGKVTEVFF